jgi:hypothetical protein
MAKFSEFYIPREICIDIPWCTKRRFDEWWARNRAGARHSLGRGQAAGDFLGDWISTVGIKRSIDASQPRAYPPLSAAVPATDPKQRCRVVHHAPGAPRWATMAAPSFYCRVASQVGGVAACGVGDARAHGRGPPAPGEPHGLVPVRAPASGAEATSYEPLPLQVQALV